MTKISDVIGGLNLILFPLAILHTHQRQLISALRSSNSQHSVDRKSCLICSMLWHFYLIDTFSERIVNLFQSYLFHIFARCVGVDRYELFTGIRLLHASSYPRLKVCDRSLLNRLLISGISPKKCNYIQGEPKNLHS